MFGVFLLRSSNRQVHHGRDDRVWSAASMPGWRKIPSHEEYIHAIRERNQNIARNGLMSERALGAGASAAATGSLAPHNTKGNASIKKSKGKRAIRKKKSRPQILLEKAPQQKRTTRSNAQLPLQSQKDAKNAPEQADQAYVSVQLALPTHPCEFCGRLFGTKGGRTRHAQVSYPAWSVSPLGEYVISCSSCEADFFLFCFVSFVIGSYEGKAA